MRRLLLVPALALAVIAAMTAPAGAGDQRTSLHRGVSVVLAAGWHMVRGRISYVSQPAPMAVATFRVRLARQSCECGMPNVAHFPRAGALLFVWEYQRLAHRDLRYFPAHAARFRIGRSVIAHVCAPSDGRTFRERGRGFQAEIYLGPAAPASARAQIAAILDSWRVS
ncbi:MAG TPA: hypothetical protein VGG07_17715 [Solirubrobacteraceae bacterium]